jgi:AraC-like DNA-binding protein/quercetin dioxygenase-like cupin family protein
MDSTDFEIAAMQGAASRAVAVTRALARSERIAPHTHPRAQLLCVSEGLAIASTASARWVLPAGRALWIPAHEPHAIEPQGATRVLAAYVEPRVAGIEAPVAMALTALLRELVERLARLQASDEAAPEVLHTVELLLLEARAQPPQPLGLHVPDDPIVRELTRGWVDGDREEISVEDAAARHGISTKTLQRRFERATGMAPARWRRHARLLRSLELLAAGRPVTEVALEVGYQTPSAYIDAFKDLFGTTPARYLPRP